METTPFDVVQYIETPRRALAYLEVALEDDGLSAEETLRRAREAMADVRRSGVMGK